MDSFPRLLRHGLPAAVVARGAASQNLRRLLQVSQNILSKYIRFKGDHQGWGSVQAGWAQRHRGQNRSKFGLTKLSYEGPIHQAGSDSLLTLKCYFQLRKILGDRQFEDKANLVCGIQGTPDKISRNNNHIYSISHQYAPQYYPHPQSHYPSGPLYQYLQFNSPSSHLFVYPHSYTPGSLNGAWGGYYPRNHEKWAMIIDPIYKTILWHMMISRGDLDFDFFWILIEKSYIFSLKMKQ